MEYCDALFFFFSSRRRHTRYIGDWSSDVCSSDLPVGVKEKQRERTEREPDPALARKKRGEHKEGGYGPPTRVAEESQPHGERREKRRLSPHRLCDSHTAGIRLQRGDQPEPRAPPRSKS